MNKDSAQRISNKGFTLVELLVVVSIIALLVSILLPTLGRARQRAISIKCQSNLKSIAHAALTWSVDHQGRILPAEAKDLSGHILADSDKGKWSQLLLKGNYIEDWVPLFCPNKPATLYSTGYGVNKQPGLPEYGQANFEYYNSSGNRESPKWHMNFPMDMILHPSERLFLVDFDEWQFNRDLIERTPSFYPAERHGTEGAVNAAFFDGSVSTVTLEQSIKAMGYED